MKHILFIDDSEKISKLQKIELNTLLQNYDLYNDISVDSKTYFLEMEEFIENKNCLSENNTYLNKTVNEIINDVLNYFTSGAEKIELVIDLCLDDKNPSTGINLVKTLIENDDLKRFFDNNTLIITLTSMYISADFDRLSEGILSSEEINKLLYCHRPIKNDSFDKNRYAFPEYYMQFKEKISNEHVKDLLSQKTYYGNFFGMILARLICSED